MVFGREIALHDILAGGVGEKVNPAHDMADCVRRIVQRCGELGIAVLTLFAFSTENWARPPEEVEAIGAWLRRVLA